MTLPAVRDEVGLQMTGKEVIESATEWANALMAVVEDRKLYATIGGKKHLVAEAWETIGAFDRVAVDVAFVNPLTNDDGQTNGYQAKVNLLKDGIIISSGIMSCGFEEYPCRGKQGMAKHRAAMSAAQTWAMAKAYRMKYSYVAVLAGFDAVPADEVHADAKVTVEPAQQAPAAKPPAKARQRPVEPTDGKDTPLPPAEVDAGADARMVGRVVNNLEESAARRGLMFKNLGEFYTAAHERWSGRKEAIELGVRDAVRTALGVETDDELTDYALAWAELVEKWG